MARIPTARNAVVGFAPTELIDEAPAPLPLMRQHKVLHIESALTVFGMFFDIQEVGAVGREDSLNVLRYITKPRDVFFRRDKVVGSRTEVSDRPDPCDLARLERLCRTSCGAWLSLPQWFEMGLGFCRL